MDKARTKTSTDLIPRPRWLTLSYYAQSLQRIFGEDNFAVVSAHRRDARSRRIRLEEIAVSGARLLNGGGMFYNRLDLDEDEIVEVLCETARILLLDEKVRDTLNALCVPPRLRTVDSTPRD